MSLSSIQLLQPTIIKFNNNENLPNNIRNKYVITLNVTGISWFMEHFIVLENDNGFLLQENDNCGKFLLEDFGSDKFDIPRIYFIIKEEYLKSDKDIFRLIQKALTNNSIYGKGDGNLIPELDYYINKTLYVYLTRTQDSIGNPIEQFIEENELIVLPNYLTSDGNINYKYFDILNDVESNYTNIKYYFKKNKALDYPFTENEINNLCSTFAKIILEISNISEEDLLETTNQGYKACLEYISNGKSDCATRLMQLILGNYYPTNNTLSPTLDTCGNCNSSSKSSSNNELSCLETYRAAMIEILKSMLGNTDFYNDWFMDEMGNPNTCLTQLIRELLDAYKEINKSIDIMRSKNCGCPRIKSSSNSSSNYDDFENYKKILDYIDNCEIEKNKNKIKLFGQEFADKLISICLN